ncbi:unnamed protein product [Fasciola hepatica]|uniref:Uncharacterized protein n=1 Tax=Fasciola hepatica TaxID=6192 RepID=A0ABC9HHZ0_FASHE
MDTVVKLGGEVDHVMAANQNAAVQVSLKWEYMVGHYSLQERERTVSISSTAGMLWRCMATLSVAFFKYIGKREKGQVLSWELVKFANGTEDCGQGYKTTSRRQQINTESQGGSRTWGTTTGLVH